MQSVELQNDMPRGSRDVCSQSGTMNGNDKDSTVASTNVKVISSNI